MLNVAPRGWAWHLLLIVTLSGCGYYKVEQHVAAPNPPGTLAKLFVVDELGSRDRPLMAGFQESFRLSLAACKVNADFYQTDRLELNGLRDTISAFRQSQSDAVLSISPLEPGYSGLQRGMVFFDLSTTQEPRELWKARVLVMFSGLAPESYVREVGGKLGQAIVRQMADDRVLGSCPPVSQ